MYALSRFLSASFPLFVRALIMFFFYYFSSCMLCRPSSAGFFNLLFLILLLFFTIFSFLLTFLCFSFILFIQLCCYYYFSFWRFIMIDYEVLGIKKSERKSKTTGNLYMAVNLYLAYEDPSVSGIACQEVFCRGDSVPVNLTAGDHVHVFYNRFGSVEGVDKIG